MNSAQTRNQILCILFSDLKGYSSLKNDRLKNQIVQEMKAALQRIGEPEVQLIKTMGDGLMMCSFAPLPLAITALRLRDVFKTTDWKTQGFPEDFLIRIGLHLDQVIIHYREDGTIEDAIGTAVDTTARIEPVTEPNAVFCSKLFYDHLIGRGVGKIKGIPQGRKALAKQFGEMDLYELRWMHESEVAEAPTPQPTVVLTKPMPNIKKPFTDKDQKDFLRRAFEIIRSYFSEAVKQLQGHAQGIEAEVTSISDLKLTCEIYLNGQLKTRCKIWIGSMMGTHEYILYSENYHSINDDSGSNEIVTVENDGQRMYLKSSFGVMFARKGPDTTKPSTPEQVAEHLWLRLTQILER
jgi:Adenylate and Guanylate cyclase catalytic domain